MRWTLALKQGDGFSGLTPIRTGTRSEMLDLAAGPYRALWWPKGRGEDLEDCRRTDDGAERAPSWVKGTNLCIVPAALLPQARRRSA